VSGKLTYANVMSTLAVFLALGGGGFAIAAALKKNSVGPKQVQNESLKAKELKNNKAVGSSEVIEDSLGAGDLGTGSVGSAEVADASLQAGDLALDEPFHVVGTAGEPDFGTGGDGDCIWRDAGVAGASNPVAFYKDRNGIVHLAGSPSAADGSGGDATCDAAGGSDELFSDFRIFTLPPGYRPARVLQIGSTNGVIPKVLIIGAETDQVVGTTLPAGAVVQGGGGTGPVLIEGVSFRAAAGSGLASR
jgi:hypothetical protein